ncbi:pilus assembly protein TadG-related protein [Nocardiopsis metallicus]|jgi:Flp pilus assembly protein TadG|uniref:Flp pilus assembly protein TadG n=1 Tax=Nocardiopsis metallicus TaxID=179819 RepID=A0A840WRZ4_9ACTN|nr:pilus assembly protein TadG-related protein [Nocardiopsis metallicus]MBB5494685.1 Flp pilus assembly protein TadG [Nocardiopsis metallicus]
MRPPARDEGQLTLFFAIAVVGLLLVAGLVLDGGAQLRAAQRAQAIAEEAARAGAQAVDVDALMRGEATRLDPQQARTAATAYLNTSGATGSASAGTETVSVEATLTEPTLFLSLIGIGELSASGSATARLALEEGSP